MPIDYSKYPPNWKSEIRPAILEREGHCCKFCGVPNREAILRGKYDNREAYQTFEGYVYSYPGRELLREPDGTHMEVVECPIDRKAIKIVLTIAHLNHDITDNRPENLAALCQKCHNNYDKEYRKRNRKRNKAKNQVTLFQPLFPC